MKFFINFLFVLVILNIFCIPQTWCIDCVSKLPKASIDASTSASSSIVMDANSGRVFYSKNEDEKRAMASTTKIVTAITVIDNCPDLDKKVTIDSRAVGVEGTSIYLREGEVLSVRELLYGLMLRSGNDSAVALANYVGGSIEKFSALMNKTAKKVGASNSNFANPHGLDDENHYTTARDLAKITAYALENKDFAQIVATKNIKIPSKEEGYRFLANKNRLLNSLYGCIGVKTGYTSDAGRCLVSACERDNLRLVCVVLDCGPMFEDSANLINAVYEKYKSYEILTPYQFITSIPLENGETNTIEVYSKMGLSLPLTENEFSSINVVYDLPNQLSAPLQNNQIVGEVKVYFDKDLIFSQKICTIGDVESIRLQDKMKEILKRWSIFE